MRVLDRDARVPQVRDDGIVAQGPVRARQGGLRQPPDDASEDDRPVGGERGEDRDDLEETTAIDPQREPGGRRRRSSAIKPRYVYVRRRLVPTARIARSRANPTTQRMQTAWMTNTSSNESPSPIAAPIAEKSTIHLPMDHRPIRSRPRSAVPERNARTANPATP